MSATGGPGRATVVTVPEEDEAQLERLLREAEQGTRTTVKKRKKREPTKKTGEGDLEPAIDTTHLSNLEREQQREIIERASVGPDVAPSILRSRYRRGLTEQSLEIEATVSEQDSLFNKNVEEAYDTLEEIKDRGESEPAVIVETEDGPVEMTKGEYRKLIDDYINRYKDWRAGAIGVVGELQEARVEAFGQVSQWAKNVTERNQLVQERKQEYNQALTNLTAGAMVEAMEPQLTKAQRDFGITGIPGPAAPPRPGSFGDQLQNRFGLPATAAVKETLAFLEKPFVSVTTQVRTRGERLQEEGEAEKSYKGFGKFMEGVVLITGAAAFDAATIGIRPGLLVKSAVSTGLLLTDPETQQAVAEKALTDPFTFTAEIAGTISGAALGSKLSNIGQTLFKERGPIFRAAKAEFQVSGIRGVPRTIRAVGFRGTTRLDFNQLLKEEISLYEFPSETVMPEPFEIYTKFKTPEIKPEFRRIIDPFDFRLDTRLGEFTQLGRGGTLVRTGEGIMELPIQVPEHMTIPATLFRKTFISLVEPSGRPAIPISIPQLTAITKPGISITGALAAFSLPKIRDIQRVSVTQIQRPGTVQQNLQRFNRELANKTRNIQKPPSGITVQGVRQVQPQLQRQTPTQIPRIEVPQIVIPRIPQPEEQPPDEPFPGFTLPPPPTQTTKTVFDFDPRKKKKDARRKTIVKKAVEKRTDPLEIINWDPRKKRKRK